LFYAQGGDPFDQFPEPGRLIGLQSFSLRAVIPEPSTWALLVLGGVMVLVHPPGPQTPNMNCKGQWMPVLAVEPDGTQLFSGGMAGGMTQRIR
jgi:hypothetical protein